MMEKSLTMALENLPVSAAQPTEALQSFLAYLKVARAVDISDKNKVAAEVKGLCKEFRVDYASAFPSGFGPSGYPNDLDRATMLWNLSATEMWPEALASSRWPLSTTGLGGFVRNPLKRRVRSKVDSSMRS